MSEKPDSKKKKVVEQQQQQQDELLNVEPRPSAAFKATEEDAITEHALSLGEFVEKFDASNIDTDDTWKTRGLSSQEAAERLARNGPNELTPPKETPEIVRFLRQFLNLLMILLMIAGVVAVFQQNIISGIIETKKFCFSVHSSLGFLSLAAYIYNTSDPVNLYLTIILFLAVLITCSISYFEERQTAKVMKTFQAMLPPDAAVMRDGSMHTMPTSALVVGDCVRLSAGMKVSFCRDRERESIHKFRLIFFAGSS